MQSDALASTVNLSTTKARTVFDPFLQVRHRSSRTDRKRPATAFAICTAQRLNSRFRLFYFEVVNGLPESSRSWTFYNSTLSSPVIVSSCNIMLGQQRQINRQMYQTQNKPQPQNLLIVEGVGDHLSNAHRCV